jgi:GTP cyclohydrolase I
MINHIRDFLIYIGENPDREGLIDTPKRVVKSWAELYSGYDQDPAKILSTCFVDGACDEIVILKNIEFSSMCEHHVLPFVGSVDVAYIPNGKVVGLSKIARLVECFAKRLQIQEKMTSQISDAINTNLKPKGVAVVIRAHHQCMSCRGVKKHQTTMITSSMVGVFRDDLNARQEFLRLARD